MKNKLKSSILAGISALCILFPNVRNSSLKDIVKPYTGIYQCTEAKLAEYDYLDRFDEIALELKANGEFVLYYCAKGGEKKMEKGRYTYDKENQTITLIGGANGFFKKAFPLQEGVITIETRIMEQNLKLQFTRK